MRGVKGTTAELRCCRCGETDPSKFSPSQTRKRSGKWCRSCYRSYYQGKTQGGVARASEYTRSRRHRLRDELTALKVAKGCADCGVAHPAVLDFDHPTDTKMFTISQARLRFGRERLLAEADKCVVRCSNCHRIRHWAERQTEQ